MSDRDCFDLTPQQYHGGLDKLWAALGITDVQDDDVFTLAAGAICNYRTARDANHESMVLMKQLIGLLLPDRHRGCLCDGCVISEIEIARQQAGR